MYDKSKQYFSNISWVGAESAPTFTIWGRKAPPYIINDGFNGKIKEAYEKYENIIFSGFSTLNFVLSTMAGLALRENDIGYARFLLGKVQAAGILQIYAVGCIHISGGFIHGEWSLFYFALYNGKSFSWTEVGMMINFSWHNESTDLDTLLGIWVSHQQANRARKSRLWMASKCQ